MRFARVLPERLPGCAGDSKRRRRRCGSFMRAWWSRSGAMWRTEALPVPGERAPVAALEASWRECEDKLARLRERVEHARRLRPEYEQAIDRMRLGQWDAAAEALEHIVARDARARRRPERS